LLQIQFISFTNGATPTKLGLKGVEAVVQNESIHFIADAKVEPATPITLGASNRLFKDKIECRQSESLLTRRDILGMSGSRCHKLDYSRDQTLISQCSEKADLDGETIREIHDLLIL